MIVGNRKRGRRLATTAFALFVLLIVISLVVCLRKKAAPAQQPPLLPQVLITKNLFSGLN